MSLTQDLDNFRAQARTVHIPADKIALMDQATQELVTAGTAQTSLNVGAQVPDFTLPNAVGAPVQLSTLLAQGPVVISFYRGGWCPYCNLELRALQQALPEIQALGASLVAISPQTPDNSLSTAEKNSLTFAVLSDSGNTVARQFGLVFELPSYLQEVYAGFGIDLPTSNGDGRWELPIAATYVITPEGRVAYAFIDPDYTQRLDPADIVSALKALPVTVA
ncbi:peroxiredoxin-like family protein [Anthocerotibacter panamensis]|uniref:peroxiredoxin-like family protein n=1 Tax=Anthocerotibacter panamensis TaxID=2857077 RepID=UPI001C4050CA|nr:peroxiredoxin-like family protein [Anthocerotibacter panamensis]